MAGFNEGRSVPGGFGVSGSSGSVQFKQGATFGGDNEFHYNPDTDTLTITGTVSASAFLGDGSGLTGVGGGSPGTPLNSIQFNDASSFGGDADLTWTTNKLALTGAMNLSGSTAVGTSPFTVVGASGVDNGGPVIFTKNTSSFGDDWESPISGTFIISDDIGASGVGYNGAAVMYVHSRDSLAAIGFKNEDTLVGGEQSNRVTSTAVKGVWLGLQGNILQLQNNIGDTIIRAGDVGVGGENEIIVSRYGTTIGNHVDDVHQVSGTLDVSGSVKANMMSTTVLTETINTDTEADCSSYNVFKYTIDATLDITGSNPVAGASYLFILTQGAGAPYTVNWDGFKWPNGGTLPVLSTGAGEIDVVSGISDGTFIYADITKNFI